MSASIRSGPPEPDPMPVDPTNLGSVDPLSIEGIFLVALGKNGSERESFLNSQCQDPAQKQRVEALLAAYEQAGNFLEKPAVTAEPTPVGQYLTPCNLPGTLGKLGPYEILEEIGRGGMGVVFRAHDPQLQRIVAVKALAPELARLPTARQRFLREARAAAAISHPHVVTIFAVDGTEEASLGTERTTLPYLVMECIVGQTLHDKIKRVGALQVEEIVRISRQIAEGLGAAHKRGLIHRDIKPANILLENGVERVKITDFGLARTTSDGGITHTGEILGTPQCMSPEQARGEMVDQRSDLFSLGCVMYTMCTGVSPFRADNMLAVMKKVCESEPRPIAQLNPNLPEWLCQLVHRLLEKQPERRVQTANEVVEVLEARSVASGPRAAQANADRATMETSRLHPESIPKWLLTPIIPGLEQWLFKDSLLPVTLLAMLIGFFAGEDRESRVLMLPVAGAVGIGLLALLKVWLKAPWNWITWKSMITVPAGMFVGGVCRAWLIFRSRAGVGIMEEMARRNAGWFVFPLAIAIFWFLTRYFRGLFIQNPQSVSEVQTPPARPTHWSTWVILAMTVIVGGMLTVSPTRHAPGPNVIEPMLFIYIVALNVWIFVHLVAWGVRLAGSRSRTHSAATVAPQEITAARPRITPWTVLCWLLGFFAVSGLGLGLAVAWISSRNAANNLPMQLATYVIRIPGAENMKYLTIDGQRPFLQLGAPNEWRITTTPGTHSIYVAYSSDSFLNQERFFTTIASVEQGRTTVVAAEPVMVRSLTRPPGIEAPTPRPTDKPLEPNSTSSSVPPISVLSTPLISQARETTPSIPLADCVEVLTDPKTMPDPAMILDTGFLQTTDRGVWIDEPGLLIRLKRLDFEGTDRTGIEFHSKVTWGTGGVLDQDGPAELLPGRYQVLVQDLDYGWAIDRRGTITLPAGKLHIHVKRTFQGQQLSSSGSDQFPLPFRWAGKTYQIVTPEEVQIVNALLAATTAKHAYFAPESFRAHPLFVEAVQIDPQGAGHSLKHERKLTQIEIQSADMQVGFISPLGRLDWHGPHKSTAGVFVPKNELRMFVKDELVGWDSPGWYDNPPIGQGDSLVVVRRDRPSIKKFSETGPGESTVINVHFHWFGTSADLPRKSAPAVRRLISAWADGNPDVPEAELLQLGGATSMEELWKLPLPPGTVVLFAPEKKDQEPKPEFVPPAFLVPGTAPGRWRIKEPPEGAVTPLP